MSEAVYVTFDCSHCDHSSNSSIESFLRLIKVISVSTTVLPYVMYTLKKSHFGKKEQFYNLFCQTCTGHLEEAIDPTASLTMVVHRFFGRDFLKL